MWSRVAGLSEGTGSRIFIRRLQELGPTIGSSTTATSGRVAASALSPLLARFLCACVPGTADWSAMIASSRSGVHEGASTRSLRASTCRPLRPRSDTASQPSVRHSAWRRYSAYSVCPAARAWQSSPQEQEGKGRAKWATCVGLGVKSDGAAPWGRLRAAGGGAGGGSARRAEGSGRYLHGAREDEV